MYEAPKFECKDCKKTKLVYDFFQGKYGQPSKRCRECQRALNKQNPSLSERLRHHCPEPAWYVGMKRKGNRKLKKPDQGHSADGSGFQF